MKKIIIILAIMGFCFSADSAKGNPLSSITHFLGDVVYKRSASNDWSPVAKGMVFFDQDKIKTYRTGKAELFFYSGTQVKIAPDTEVTFEAEKEGLSKSLYVSYGQVANKVRRGDQFALQTPHAAIFVKGTEFDIKVDEDGLDVWVAEGLVVVENSNGSMQSEKNTHTNTNKNSEPSKSKINKGDMPKWKEEFKAKAMLTAMSPGKKTEGEVFQINVTLRDPETNRPFKGIAKLNVKSLKEGLLLTQEQDTEPSLAELDLEVINGSAKVYAKGVAGDHEISITGEDLTGVRLPLKIDAVIKERKVILKVLDDDGIEQNIEIIYKRK